MTENGDELGLADQSLGIQHNSFALVVLIEAQMREETSLTRWVTLVTATRAIAIINMATATNDYVVRELVQTS